MSSLYIVQGFIALGRQYLILLVVSFVIRPVRGRNRTHLVFPPPQSSIVCGSINLEHSSGLLSALGLNSGDVLAGNSVPGGHVLVHACGHALLLAGRQRCAWLWDALLEAVLVEFLT